MRTILVVCTANICRSPMAEALLARQLGADYSSVRVRSAGVNAVGGRVDELARLAMATRGLDITNHRPTGVTARDITGATLVLTMERAHVAEIAASVPGAFPKTFGLTEIVELGARHGGRRADETISTWRARMQLGRSPADILRAGAAFDVADPHGGSPADYERCADQLTRLIIRLVMLLDGPVEGPPRRAFG